MSCDKCEQNKNELSILQAAYHAFQSLLADRDGISDELLKDISNALKEVIDMRGVNKARYR